MTHILRCVCTRGQVAAQLPLYRLCVEIYTWYLIYIVGPDLQTRSLRRFSFLWPGGRLDGSLDEKCNAVGPDPADSQPAVCFCPWPGRRADFGSRGSAVLPPGIDLGVRPCERPPAASLLGAVPPQRARADAASLPPLDHDDQGERNVLLLYHFHYFQFVCFSCLFLILSRYVYLFL